MRTLSNFAHYRAAILLSFSIILLAFAVPSPASANGKYSGIVIDAKTGKTLYSHKADTLRYPASLTKMMTMYMMFEALETGKLSKSTRIRMSKYAASKPPSKLGIKAGGSISAENAILALATKSANDVAAAVAEHLGGSEANFGVIMTKKARYLGMSRTTFKNASGLTARGQLTTARDMARLGIALREHYPQYYHYFSTRSFKYGRNRYNNHNRLLGAIKGVDGIKTGYTKASGFNLVSSVESNKRSIVAVVIGGRSGKSRNAQMQKLISRYLGKATSRKKRTLIAKPKSNGAVLLASAGSIQLPKRGPLPTPRPTTTAGNSIDITKPVAYAAVSIPTPKVSAPDVTNIDTQTTASISKKPTGWIIQIAAAGSRTGATELLEDARRRVPSELGARQKYIESTVKNGVTLYRARFSGFSGKSEARNTCKTLKKNKISCLALAAS